jgi:hypothetical protein
MAKLTRTNAKVDEAQLPEDEVLDQVETDDEVEGDDVELEDEIDESAASDTLKPNSMPVGPANKSWAVGKIVNAVAGMDHETINKFVATMELIGKEARNIPDGDAAKNKSTLSTKPSAAAVQLVTKLEDVDDALASVIREDVSALFEGQELTEEFKERVSTLIESAINMKVAAKAAELEDQLSTQYEEEMDSISESLIVEMDRYLDEAVNEWISENEVAIESSIRADLVEEFVESLRALFETHYISVPEERVDVIEEMGNRIEELELLASEKIDEAEELRAEIEQILALSALDEMSEGLTDSESEKLAELAESVEFSDVEEFKSKVSVLREQYFGTGVRAPSMAAQNLFEQAEHISEDVEKPAVPRSMQTYVSTISRTHRS